MCRHVHLYIVLFPLHVFALLLSTSLLYVKKLEHDNPMYSIITHLTSNVCMKFKVCKSMHHHTIKINLPTRCNNFSSYYLIFMYSSTCFGRPHARHQELSNCSSSLWFYRWSVVVAVLLVVVGPAGPTTTNSTALHS